MEAQFKLLLQEWREEIHARLRHLVDEQEPSLLYEPIQYVLEGGGKRIRPVLLLLACRAVSGSVKKAWEAAIAIELLHNFTLVHDDIMDDDDTRRGRLTVHKKWTPDVAILAGDGLLALSYRILFRTHSDRFHDIANIFNEGIITVCEGQALDLAFESQETVSPDEYLEMIKKKTAGLLNISARIGAIIGGGSEDEVAAMGKFADNLGCAFQIQDDLLDITSDEQTLGKTFGSDVQQKKQTYLVIHALSHADSAGRVRLAEILSDSNTGEIEIREVRALFQKAGSLDAAKAAVSQFLASAQSNLDTLRKTPERSALFELVSYISTRNA